MAVVLSLLLLAELTPVQVYAANERGGGEATGGSIEETGEESGLNREMLGEAEEYRESDTKHFQNTDGSYTAVKYAQPVHYQAEADGKWEDIDNRMRLTDAKDAPGVERAREAGSDAFGADTEEVYVPQSSPLDVILAKESGGRYLATQNSGGNTLSWGYAVERPGKEPEELNRREGRVLELDGTAEEGMQYSAVRNVTGGLVYPDVAESVDLEYILDSVHLKENIVLKTAGAANSFLLTYDVGDLNAEQISEKEIALRDAEDETVFTLYAPNMVDAAMASSGGVTLEIVSAEDGVLTVRLRADSTWLEDEARSFPVRIDPYVYQGVMNANQDATAIYKPHSSGESAGTLILGNDYGTYGKTRAYVKFSLPTLSAGDVVVSSHLNVSEYEGQYGFDPVGISTFQINVYQVTSSWTASSVQSSTYYNNLPSKDDTVVDYGKVSASTCGTWVALDVTRLTKGWYENSGSNYGVCLEAADPTEWVLARFVSADNTSIPTRRPTLEVTYLNSRGLEGRWTNHSQSLGRSGSGYINDYTGNLVYITPVVSTAGNRMPVSVSLVYNGFQHGQLVDRASKVGKGWRLNVQENVVAITSGGTGLNATLYAEGYRYIYEDGDGTQHYFRLKEGSNTICEDEEGMGLILKVNSSVTDLEKYVIEADTGGKMTFTPAGNLRKVYDTDGNYYKIFYLDDGRIDEIDDGVGRGIRFTYCTDSGNTNRVASIKDPSNHVTTFTYSDYGSLSTITYPDGKTTHFSYDDSYRMTQARGTDNCRLQYSYASTGDAAVKNRVAGITEYNETGGTAGNSLTIDYSGINRTVFTDNKGRSETYQFDNYGRTVEISDAAGNNGVYKYVSGEEENRKTANALKSISVGQRYVNNMLRNHSFERNQSWDLSASGAEYTTGSHYLGERSVKLSGSGAYATQTVNILPDYNYYSFSAYVKTDSETTDATVSMKFLDGNGDPILINNEVVIVKSNPIKYETGWQRLAVSGKIPEGTGKIRVRCMTSGAGNAWFDCAQLETGMSVNEYNLVENGNFDDAGATGVWTMQNGSGSDGLQWAGTDGFYKLNGSPTVEKRVVQTIPINRVGNKTFLTLSAKARGESVPLSGDRRFSLGIVAHYADGSVGTVRWAKFNPDYSAGWQDVTNTVGFNTSGIISYVEVFCAYGKNANTARFDKIQVNLDETGVTYTYDEKGNMISATDNAKRNQAYTYSNANEMTGATTADNKHYSFTYDSTNKHRLIKATSATDSEHTTPKLEFSFNYDSYGNVTSTKVTNGAGKYIRQYTEYTSNGNYVAAVYNDRGYATTYNYNTTKGTLRSVTDPEGRSTYYVHNGDNDRLERVSDSSDSTQSTATTVEYTYSGERLQKLKTPSTEYGFTYDSFGNAMTTKAGNYVLAQNTYEANNGNLTGVTYGNGFTVSYGYDSLDRLTTKSYTGSQRYAWSYNAENKVGRHWDYVNGRDYTYTYDGLGRPLRTDVSDGSWIQHEYNTVDQSTKLRYYYDDVLRTVSYGYSGADNLPSYTTFSSIGKVSTSYDSLTRLWQKSYKTNAGDSGVTAEYSYINWEGPDWTNRSTGMVRGIDYSYTSGGLTLPDLYYTYDESGNIETERVWAPNDGNPLRERYSYDAKNQLTRHDSATQNATFTYEYDKAGNITAKKQYAYTTGTDLDMAVSTKGYEYSSTGWKDLLVEYNNNPVTYDNLGNMTSYNGATYLWNGRELRQVNKNGSIYSYRYNADGIRTRKTTNGTATEFFLNGTQILAQKTGSDVMWFFYDSQGSRIGLVSNDTVYYYLYNLQGDVVALARASTGEIAARYSYDAWGSCTVTNASGYTVGTKNPFRYRGYYYDSETGLYYLNSRYYSPEFGRFISADVYVSTGQGLQGSNMFAYCGNNPVMGYDPSGMYWRNQYNLCMADSGSGCGGGGDIAIGLFALLAYVGTCISRRFNGTTTPPITSFRNVSPAIPATSIPESEEKEEAKEKAQTQQYNYWQADLINHKVIISTPLTLNEACVWVSMGGSVMCRNEGAARMIVWMNGYHNYVGPEIHGECGFYRHFHPTRNHTGYSSIHIWFFQEGD